MGKYQPCGFKLSAMRCSAGFKCLASNVSLLNYGEESQFLIRSEEFVGKERLEVLLRVSELEQSSLGVGKRKPLLVKPTEDRQFQSNWDIEMIKQIVKEGSVQSLARPGPIQANVDQGIDSAFNQFRGAAIEILFEIHQKGGPIRHLRGPNSTWSLNQPFDIDAPWQKATRRGPVSHRYGRIYRS